MMLNEQHFDPRSVGRNGKDGMVPYLEVPKMTRFWV
jgi:hypothetical protein